ncbi:MAG TPA: V-type ATPase 116kDa subunit family protein [Gemmatimonadaceae bacterium]|nr:V-type ATPase 116kDa subunit family protein [Gemmatimonadaceae bacterium]
MARVRVMGPRERFGDTLRAMQDDGHVHVDDATPRAGLAPMPDDPRDARRRRQFERLLDDITTIEHTLGPLPRPAGPATCTVEDFARWGRLARRTRQQALRLAEQVAQLGEERALIERYRDFLDAILPVVRRVARSPRLTCHAVVVPEAARAALDRVTAALRTEIGDDFAIATHPLEGGEIAVLLVLPTALSQRLEAKLSEARVPEVPMPGPYRDLPLDVAVPKMLERLQGIPAELAAARDQGATLLRTHGPELARARAAAQDWLAAADARRHCAVTSRLFAIEGWIPEPLVPPLAERLARDIGTEIVVETVARESWQAAEAPVVLSNPRIFRPFEKLIAIMPLPTYGTIDPTPFVAVFFPMFFGMMLGDIGYGLILGAGVAIAWKRAAPGSLWRAAAEIALPCAVFTVIFGAVYGEFFGDAGRRLLGIHHVLFDREESMLASLAAAAGLGVMHIVLGLVLGAVSAFRHERRQAIGRAVSALMVLLVVLALLAAFEVLPRALFTPAVVALVVAFPLLVLAEGIVAPIELLGALGNILSYARVMAIGTASVILAVVANRMVGMIGSTLVGLLFALLFHLVNFAIGLFSPAIHALRLHYVEFFGKFYSPGGRPYRPFGHWSPAQGH